MVAAEGVVVLRVKGVGVVTDCTWNRRGIKSPLLFDLCSNRTARSANEQPTKQTAQPIKQIKRNAHVSENPGRVFLGRGGADGCGLMDLVVVVVWFLDSISIRAFFSISENQKEGNKVQIIKPAWCSVIRTYT